MNSLNSPLREKSLLFAIRIVTLNQYLTKTKKEFVMSHQITKSGTNPGAMVREAANAESSLDFVHKLGVAQKEIAETQYWLELLRVVAAGAFVGSRSKFYFSQGKICSRMRAIRRKF